MVTAKGRGGTVFGLRHCGAPASAQLVLAPAVWVGATTTSERPAAGMSHQSSLGIDCPGCGSCELRTLLHGNVWHGAVLNAPGLAAWCYWYGPIWLGTTATWWSTNRELGSTSLGTPGALALTAGTGLWCAKSRVQPFNSAEVAMSRGEVKPHPTGGHIGAANMGQDG